MTALRRLVTAVLLGALGVLLTNRRAFPVLRTGSRADRAGRTVSLLVPARDETGRLAATLPSIAAQPADELLLLDDCSADATAALAGALLAGAPHARVLPGAEPPAGWVGKTWALHQLAAAATGDVLVFCDSDVHLAPGALDAALAEADRQGADVFSVFPRQVTATLGEALVVPLLDEVLLTGLPFALLARDDVPAAAATANGSLLVLRRDALERVGGFAALRAEIVEDVALARLTRRRGLRLGLALGGELVGTRMYPGYRAAVTGLSRGLVGVAGGSRVALALGLAWVLLARTAPVLLAVRDRRWLLPAALGVALRVLSEATTRTGTRWQGALAPLTPVAVAPVVLAALTRTPTWRGRSPA